MEQAFRTHNVEIYIIAVEKELASTYTNMDLEGNLDKKYTANLRFSPQPLRPKERDGWPASPQENFERLADAGTPVDRGITKCRNCDGKKKPECAYSKMADIFIELGHMARDCKEEKREVEYTVVKCYNCDEVGHRVRDW